MSTDQPILGLDDYLAIFKRRQWQFALPTVALAILASLVAFLLPATYRSSATILIERQVIPVDLVQSTVTSFADQRIQVISQRVMTTANLSQLIERYGLYPDLRAKVGMNMAVAEMRQRIKVDMISADVMDPRSGRAQEATIAFSLAFEDGSPGLAQKVTSDLVSFFLKENLEERTAAASETTNFMQAEASRLGEQVNTLEARLAAFKEEHSNTLPEVMSLNRELMMRTEERVRDNAQAIESLEQQAVYLESELAQIDPSAFGGAPVQGSGPAAQLADLEARYALLKGRYSPQHPDRLRMEKEVAALRRLVGEASLDALKARLSEMKSELALRRKRYTNDHPDVVTLQRSISTIEAQIATARVTGGSAADVGNPVYLQLRTRLEEARQKIAALKQATTALEQDRADYETRVMESPKIEQQYRALTRDYENAMSKYREVREKVMQAEMAQSLETSRKGERFVILEPPLFPERPSKPNRPAIMVLGIVLAFAGGIGHLALREVLDKGIYGARAVQTLTRIPLLGVIPLIKTARDRRNRTRRLWLLVAGLALAAVGTLTVVHVLIIPLDVLWFKLLIRFGDLLPFMNTPPA